MLQIVSMELGWDMITYLKRCLSKSEHSTNYLLHVSLPSARSLTTSRFLFLLTLDCPFFRLQISLRLMQLYGLKISITYCNNRKLQTQYVTNNSSMG